MSITPTQQNVLYTKREFKRDTASAANSAALSAGLTLAINKGKSPSLALKVGLFAGAVNFLINLGSQLIGNHKLNKANDLTIEKISGGKAESDKLCGMKAHQG